RALQRYEEELRGEELNDRLAAARVLILERPDGREPLFALLLGVLEGWDVEARVEAADALMALGKEGKPALIALRRRVRRDDSDRVRRGWERAIEAIEAAK